MRPVSEFRARVPSDQQRTEHRHGIGLLTPEKVHLGRAPEVIKHRKKVLAAAYAARPDRFVGGPAPTAAELSAEVWINRALPVSEVDDTGPADGRTTERSLSSVVSPGAGQLRKAR